MITESKIMTSLEQGNLQAADGRNPSRFEAVEKKNEKSIVERITEQEALVAEYVVFDELCRKAKQVIVDIRLQARQMVDLPLELPGLSPAEQHGAVVFVNGLRELSRLGFSTIDPSLLLRSAENLFRKGPTEIDRMSTDFRARHYQATLSLDGLRRELEARPTGDDLLMRLSELKKEETFSGEVAASASSIAKFVGEVQAREIVRGMKPMPKVSGGTAIAEGRKGKVVFG